MNRFNPGKILCPIDMSELSDLALKYAYTGSRVFDASLTVLHAAHFDYPRYLSRDLAAQVIKELDNAENEIRETVHQHVQEVLGEASGRISFDAAASDLPAPEAVLKAAGDSGADLIVMGTHGYSGLKQFMLGSVTEAVLHRSEIPVFTVRQKMDGFIDPARPEAQPEVRQVLCPCNLSDEAAGALQVAAVLADRFGAKLTAVWSPESKTPEARQKFSEWIRNTADVQISAVDPVLRPGESAAEAISLATELSADLIVIAARHRRFEQGTELGRTSERILRHGPAPVLSVPFT
jgi:nucleotide-binding universal stress UspA family protein